MPGPMKLTPKQARFVQEYLIDLNAAQAAIRAGARNQIERKTIPNYCKLFNEFSP
jgi:hypothetical protein